MSYCQRNNDATARKCNTFQDTAGDGGLQVLNIGGNKLSGLLRIKGVPKLRALIANDNAITVVKGGLSPLSPHTHMPCECATQKLGRPGTMCIALIFLSLRLHVIVATVLTAVLLQSGRHLNRSLRQYGSR
jgi:hypothetical protein